jgi:hypothetical protein
MRYRRGAADCGQYRQVARAIAQGLMHGPQYDDVGFIADGGTVKAFLAACLAAVVVAAISWIILNSVQEPVDRAFATSPYTRVGD